jgi:hypothetical protein
MKRRLLFAVIMFLMVATPARAEHSQPGTFYTGADGGRWSDTVSENYCFEGFAGPLSGAEYDNMVASTVEQMNNEVESDTQIDTNWISNGNCGSTLDFGEWSCSELRAAFNNPQSRIDYENQGNNGTRAETLTCDLDLDANNRIDFFWIAIDTEESGYDLHWNVFSTPASLDYDYSGLFTHEMIHGTGFMGHFSGASDACDTGVGVYSDMCLGTNLGIQNAGASNGTWWRSLTVHDIGAVDEVYP